MPHIIDGNCCVEVLIERLQMVLLLNVMGTLERISRSLRWRNIIGNEGFRHVSGGCASLLQDLGDGINVGCYVFVLSSKSNEKYFHTTCPDELYGILALGHLYHAWAYLSTNVQFG